MAAVETELRGRQDELQALTDALDGAAGGTGCVVLLEGEAGIGKTRLLAELARRAEALGLTIRRGSAEELEQERPFGSLVDAIGAPDTTPTFGAGGGGPFASDARFLAQDAFVDHVERLTATGPVLLEIDDLHWADRATLATLWALARRSTDLGLLLVVAYRPEPSSRELIRIVEGCVDLDAVHLRLGPIGPDALSDLAADVVGAPIGPGLRSELEGARGNPFVAIEVLRSYEDDGSLLDAGGERELRPSALPKPLRDSLLRRLTGITREASTALSVAAVLGDTGRLDDLGALLDVSAADAGVAVAEATRAGLLEPVGDQLVFRHALIREALYQDLPDAVRAGWHRAAASRLDGRAGPAVVARHLSLAALPGDTAAVSGLRRAAEELVASEPDAAVELLERASTIATDDAVRAEIATATAEALLAAGRAEDASVAADAALAVAESPVIAAKAHLARGEACTFEGRHRDALESYVAALATGALDEPAAANALSRQAVLRVLTFALDEALDEADRALAEGRRLGIDAVTVEGLTARCTAQIFGGEFERAVATGEEAVALAGDDPESIRRGPHISLGLALCGADRLDDAREVTAAGRQRSTELGQILTLAHYTSVLVRIAWFAGRWDDAIAEADTHAGLAADFGLHFGETANDGIRGLVAFHRGDLDAARAALVRHQDATYQGRGDATGLEMFTLLRAELLEADGDAAGASTALLELFGIEQAIGMTAARIWPGPACVRLALAAGNADAASDVAADLVSIARSAGTPSAEGAAAYGRGLIENDPERMVEAVTHYERAGGPRLDQLVALEIAGRVHEANGRRDDAVGLLRRALGVADELGAAYDARRIGATLRDLGVRSGVRGPRQRPSTGWEALTDAELGVARLVHAGLRNAEIADRLFISRRTVESHISHLYIKLDAENRVSLARVVGSHMETGAA